MRHNQRGATLIISLIMLVLLTLLAVTSFNLGKGSLQSVGNMQQRSAAMAAAQETMELIISNSQLSASSVLPADPNCPNGGVSNTRCIDSNQDGTPDVTVTITPNPTCTKTERIPNTRFDATNPIEAQCISSSPDNYSSCFDTIWEVTVSAVDATTQAQYNVTQGLAVQTTQKGVGPSCPAP